MHLLLLGPCRAVLLVKGGGWQSLRSPGVTWLTQKSPAERDETPALHTGKPCLQDAVATSVPAFPFLSKEG